MKRRMILCNFDNRLIKIATNSRIKRIYNIEASIIIRDFMANNF